MFERWRQENFFKYMREEFLLDALVDYEVEPDDPTHCPQPGAACADRDRRRTRRGREAEQAYGAAAVDNAETRRPTMRGFKIAHGRIGKPLRAARARLGELLAQRPAVPRRVAVRDLSDQAVIKLATERKHLTNLVRMVAYQAESDLLALLQPHYARADDEGRTLLHELFGTAADLCVTDTELVVTLAPLSVPTAPSPHARSARSSTPAPPSFRDAAHVALRRPGPAEHRPGVPWSPAAADRGCPRASLKPDNSRLG
jgi:hypothetical protein